MFSDLLLMKFKIKVAGDGTGDKTPEQLAEEKAAADKAAADALKNKSTTGEQDDPEEEEDDEELDFESLPKGAQALIKKLRKENADRRTANNNTNSRLEKFESGLKAMLGGEEDDVEPSKQLEAMQGNYESAVTRNAILELALENNISGADNVEYFEFLMSKQLNSLEEGEEMTDEILGEIVAKVAAKGAVDGSGKANTSTGGGKKPPEAKPGQVTQEQFNKMGMMERTKLFQTNRAVYDVLIKGI